MAENMRIITDWFKDYYADYMYLIIMIVAAVFLMFTNRKKYAGIVVASIVLFIVIFNPWLYKYIFAKLVFWRLFWLIPEVLIIALAVTELFGKLKKLPLKLAACAVMVVLLSIFGHNIFKEASRGENTNTYRLPQGVVNVAAIMMELDDHPRCIVQSDFLCFIRLFSGDIEPMYGRNGEGFINRATEDVQIMHAYMESDAPDYEYILSNAKDMGYNFIVNKDSRPIDESLSVKYGYGLIASTDGYNIYYNPSVTEE